MTPDEPSWFHVVEISDAVWQLTERGHVAAWLIVGSERAALVDTGCGFAAIRPLVETLTDRPVVVVQTHHHFDHIGGSHEFDQVLIHPLGVEGLATPVSETHLAAYATYADTMEDASARFAAVDDRYFHLLHDAWRVVPRPSGPWNVQPVRATGTIEEGDLVSLGDRALRVLHTPGHSPDCVSLELAGERLLIGGDTVNTGPVYTQLPASDLLAQRESLARLASLADRWDRVLCSHFLRTEVAPAYLAEQVAALDQLLEGAVPLRAGRDCVGTAVAEARFDGFSFLLPEGWTASAVVSA